jgi:alpha-1,3-glucosyltransferase
MKSAAIYALVLNFKHIYLYSAPAFGLLYVRQLILNEKYKLPEKFKNFMQLALQTAGITLISFGPFLLQAKPLS